MYLAQRDELHFARAESSEKAQAVFVHIRLRIPIGEAEVKKLLRARLTRMWRARGQNACSSRTRAESVDEPTEFFERRSFKDLESRGATQGPPRLNTRTMAARRRFLSGRA